MRAKKRTWKMWAVFTKGGFIVDDLVYKSRSHAMQSVSWIMDDYVAPVNVTLAAKRRKK